MVEEFNKKMQNQTEVNERQLNDLEQLKEREKEAQESNFAKSK